MTEPTEEQVEWYGFWNAEPPEWAKDSFNPGCECKCALCGAWEQVVRPGKTQCVACEGDQPTAAIINERAAMPAPEVSEPTDEQVEAVAKAIFRQAAKFYGWKTPWEKLMDNTRTQYRAEARAAIAAMPAPEVSVKQAAVDALAAYQQADIDGIMVLVSRQAIEECLPALRALSQAQKEDG
jgi:hypothetical protein